MFGPMMSILELVKKEKKNIAWFLRAGFQERLSTLTTTLHLLIHRLNYYSETVMTKTDL